MTRLTSLYKYMPMDPALHGISTARALLLQTAFSSTLPSPLPLRDFLSLRRHCCFSQISVD